MNGQLVFALLDDAVLVMPSEADVLLSGALLVMLSEVEAYSRWSSHHYTSLRGTKQSSLDASCVSMTVES